MRESQNSAVDARLRTRFESARSLALARRSGCGERSAAVVSLAKTWGGGAVGVVYIKVGRGVDTLNENSSVEAGKYLHYTSRNEYYADCFAARSGGLREQKSSTFSTLRQEMTLFRETYRKYGEKFYIKQIVILFFIGSRMFHNVVHAKHGGC